MTLLSRHAFEQRLAQAVARLDRLGTVSLNVSGAQHRRVRFEVLAPGVPGLTDLARFVYEEWFRWLPDGAWLRVRYNHDYFALDTGGWRGYHLHEIAPGVEPVPHAKCVASDDPGGEARHFHAFEVDLWAAHEEFERQYLMGQPVTCHGLTPID